MRVLFIGGTGLISTACADAAIAAGNELWLLNRGRSALHPSRAAAGTIVADADDEAQFRDRLEGRRFDVVVQWIGFEPSQVARDMDVFAGAAQYVFISSASVYEKPPSHWLITESTPTLNPFWKYAQNKIACEELLRSAGDKSGFPFTIIRPSLTYGPSQVPVAVGSWKRPYTIIDRMRRGAKIIVPGDGTSIWTVTHNSDFAKGLVPLFGNPDAIGEDFHITSDEALTWNQIYGHLAAAAGVDPDIVHVPSDAIAASEPEMLGSLLGDKAQSTVFDNAKLRRLVPDFKATVPFAVGIEETVAWFDAEAGRRQIDEAANERWDRLCEIYGDALRRSGEIARA